MHVFVAGGEVGAACAGRAGDFGVVGDEVFPWVPCQLGASRGRGRRNGKEEREGEDILVSFEGFKRFRFLGGTLWVMAKERGSGGVGLGLGNP